LEDNLALGEFRTLEGEIVAYEEKLYCWVELRQGSMVMPSAALEKYGFRIADGLLAIRGSDVAIGFAVRGPIMWRGL
jgi:hypothetical protein